jgi:transaldolase
LACDVLRPIWEETRGRNGYVSIEVDPNLAPDTDGSIAQATHFQETIARGNLLPGVDDTRKSPYHPDGVGSCADCSG